STSRSVPTSTRRRGSCGARRRAAAPPRRPGSNTAARCWRARPTRSTKPSPSCSGSATTTSPSASCSRRVSSPGSCTTSRRIARTSSCRCSISASTAAWPSWQANAPRARSATPTCSTAASATSRAPPTRRSPPPRRGSPSSRRSSPTCARRSPRWRPRPAPPTRRGRGPRSCPQTSNGCGPSPCPRVSTSSTSASRTPRDAEAARAIADAALAALPDRGDMVVCRDAHDRRAALQERQEKGRLVVDERRADEAAAAAAAVAAEATLREAVAADEAARAAHRAHAVRADLVAGEPCPVCRQIVTTVPDEPTPPALRTSEQRRARAERDHRAATDARGAAQKALAGAEATMAHLVAEVEAVTRELAGAPSRDEAVAAIAAVDEARAACEKASATATAARDALAAATTAQARAVDDERDAQVRFDTARDAVADLHPPARLGAGASLVDQWRLLAEWATGAAAAGDDDVGRVEKEVAALERE